MYIWCINPELEIIRLNKAWDGCDVHLQGIYGRVCSTWTIPFNLNCDSHIAVTGLWWFIHAFIRSLWEIVLPRLTLGHKGICISALAFVRVLLLCLDPKSEVLMEKGRVTENRFISFFLREWSDCERLVQISRAPDPCRQPTLLQKPPMERAHSRLDLWCDKHSAGETKPRKQSYSEFKNTGTSWTSLMLSFSPVKIMFWLNNNNNKK